MVDENQSLPLIVRRETWQGRAMIRHFGVISSCSRGCSCKCMSRHGGINNRGKQNTTAVCLVLDLVAMNTLAWDACLMAITVAMAVKPRN